MIEPVGMEATVGSCLSGSAAATKGNAIASAKDRICLIVVTPKLIMLRYFPIL
jgi:hypothetical protein